MQSGYKVSLGLAIVGFGVACYSMLSTAAGLRARAAARPGTVPLLCLLYLLSLALSPQRVTHCSEHTQYATPAAVTQVKQSAALSAWPYMCRCGLRYLLCCLT
jgi:hypothetical protein